MFYAIRICGNPNHKRYNRPLEFMVEGTIENEDDEVPLMRSTYEDIKKALKGNGLYEAGWVQIIEID